MLNITSILERLKIKLLLATILLFTLKHTHAQAPSKQWDARFGGSDEDNLRSIQQTTDGGYILGGFSLSDISGDKTQASQGNDDYWIVKTNANGVKQWDVRFGGSNSDYLRSIQQTSDGGYIFGGSSSSGISGDKTQASRGLSDYWIVKTDANGVKQWDARFGGSKDDILSSIQLTTDSGYILGGYSRSDISEDKSQDNQGSDDYWIIKTDANGVKQWDARFGGNSFDILYSLQQTTDGGYILGGYSLSGISGDKTQASQGNYDYWIVKTNANGVKQWDACFGGSSEDYLRPLQQTTDGGYILGGESESGIGGDKTQASQGSSDYWIVKTDANGVKQWDARFGGSGSDLLYSLQQTSDGGYILGGYSLSGISGDKTQASQGESDYWIVKTDANGIKQWDARFGGSSYENLRSVQQTPDGGYILGGESESGISGDKTRSSQGGDDYWIVKTTECDGTSLPFIIATGPTTFCQGGNVILTSNNCNSEYQWMKNGTIISGATNSSYVVTSSGSYLVTNLNGSSNSISVTVNPKPQANITPIGGNLNLCAGPVKLRANNGTNLAYQWYKSNQLISGATKRDYVPLTTGNYKVQVTNTQTTCWKLSPSVTVVNSCKEIEPTIEQSKSELLIYPNPAQDHVMISLQADEELNGDVVIRISNALGQTVKVHQTAISNGILNEQISTSDLPSGIYSVTISGEGIFESKLLLKE